MSESRRDSSPIAGPTWRWLLALGCSTCLACAAESTESAQCVQPIEAAIHAGHAEPEAWALSYDRKLALAGLYQDPSAEEPACTATLIASGWMLSAAHCAGGPSQRLRFGAARAAHAASVQPCRSFVHPRDDVMLLRFAEDAPATACATPIDLHAAAIDDAWLDREATLAGRGRTDNPADQAGALRFVTERILQVDARTLDVDGAGKSGACVGDSGGPLLIRENDHGAPKILGVLSVGSSSCVGVDRYVRSDVIAAWVTETMEREADAGCAAVEP